MSSRRAGAATLSHEAQLIQELETLEDEAHRRCARLAPLLAQPAHARDTEALRQLWLDVNEMRPALLGVLNRMRKGGGPPSKRRKGSSSADLRNFRNTRKALDNRLKAWSDIADMVLRHVDPEPVRLIPADIPVAADPLTEFLAATLHQVSSPNEQSEEGFNHGAYADIAMPPLKFEALIHAAYRLALARGTPSTMRFADIGCGGGVKLVMARRFFGHCTGIEYDETYVRNGEEFLGKVGLKQMDIEHADALTYTDYSKFDVIYFYRPMRSDQMLEQLEQQIISQVRPGTLVLAPYDHFLKPRTTSGFATVSSSLDACAELVPPIFTVGMSQQEADVWRQDAERIDTMRIPHPDSYGFHPGFWRPVLDASRFAISSSARL